MEKDRHYRAYEGLKATNNGNTSSLKRNTDPSKPRPDQIRCLCFGGVSDKASHHSFLKGFIINVGICGLLVGYTVLGSFIFLAIEGGTDGGLQQRTLATIASSNQPQRWNSTVWLNKPFATLVLIANCDNPPRLSSSLYQFQSFHEKKLYNELVLRDTRNQTVENIWQITEHLNILYRENWTRLAEQEIMRFQEKLVKKINDELLANHAGTFTGATVNNDGPIERKVLDYEWNFAKAFLYSLTVLTTI
ncbi:GSCOCG00000842001-RA-CDS, partial [Cotesia congregata]